jgi:hypothetical protein
LLKTGNSLSSFKYFGCEAYLAIICSGIGRRRCEKPFLLFLLTEREIDSVNPGRGNRAKKNLNQNEFWFVFLFSSLLLKASF